MEFRRKLYKRGSSYETTIPKPIIFFIEPSRKYEVVFKYDKEKKRWYIDIEEQKTLLQKQEEGEEREVQHQEQEKQGQEEKLQRREKENTKKQK